MTDLILHQIAGDVAARQLDQPSLPMDDLDGPADPATLVALVESLLLVAPAPSTIDELARGAGVAPNHIESALATIETESGRGWVLQRHHGRVQLATAPEFASYIRRFLGLDREAKLSPAALEALAVIAYQQPVTRSDVETIRGVDCSGVIQTLLTRGLIDQVGRLGTAGNPIVYGTTSEFLQIFGFRSLADLTPLGEIDGRDVRTALASTLAAEDSAFRTDSVAAD